VRIDGRTRLAGVIGWPVEHSLSPAMHNAAYETLGLNWVYVPLPVPSHEALFAVVEALRALPFVGFNVTMPYKQVMLELCDETATLAEMAGAVNTVQCLDGRLIGYNTDGRGLLESLETDVGFDPADASVAVIGAGGAAGAAVTALVLAKAARLAIINRDVSHAERLRERISGHLRGTSVSIHALDAAEEDVRGADLVVNATPLGMEPEDPSPIPRAWLRRDQVVLDMVYGGGRTTLVRDAEQAGARAVDGLGLLVAQGALAIDIWAAGDSGQVRAPRDVMRAAAETAADQTAARNGGDAT